MELSKTYPCRKQVPWRVLDTEALVVDVKAGLIYPLNSVGTRIWQLCDGQLTVGEIVQVIMEEFDASEGTIREDTLHFLQELVQAKLLSLSHQPPPQASVGLQSRRNETGG